MEWRAKVIKGLRTLALNGPIHGSVCRSLVLDYAPGACDSYEAEKLLELALEPIIEEGPKPTPSQAAFLGLQFERHPGFVAGAKEHFSWRLPG